MDDKVKKEIEKLTRINCTDGGCFVKVLRSEIKALRATLFLLKGNPAPQKYQSDLIERVCGGVHFYNNLDVAGFPSWEIFNEEDFLLFARLLNAQRERQERSSKACILK